MVDGTEVIQEVHSKPKSPGGPPLPSGSASGSPSSQQSKVARLTQSHYIDISYSINVEISFLPMIHLATLKNINRGVETR